MLKKMKQSLAAGVLAVPLLVAHADAANWNAEVVRTLRSDKSIFKFGPETKLEPIGTIRVGTARYFIAYYAWEETRKEAGARGGFPHAAYRLLIFKKGLHYLNFLGFYSVDGPPIRIVGGEIQFSYPGNGNKIVLGKAGPPRRVLLNGELRDLGR
jgi:hypothetical protein